MHGQEWKGGGGGGGAVRRGTVVGAPARTWRALRGSTCLTSLPSASGILPDALRSVRLSHLKLITCGAGGGRAARSGAWRGVRGRPGAREEDETAAQQRQQPPAGAAQQRQCNHTAQPRARSSRTGPAARRAGACAPLPARAARRRRGAPHLPLDAGDVLRAVDERQVVVHNVHDRRQLASLRVRARKGARRGGGGGGAGGAARAAPRRRRRRLTFGP